METTFNAACLMSILLFLFGLYYAVLSYRKISALKDLKRTGRVVEGRIISKSSKPRFTEYGYYKWVRESVYEYEFSIPGQDTKYRNRISYSRVETEQLDTPQGEIEISYLGSKPAVNFPLHGIDGAIYARKQHLYMGLIIIIFSIGIFCFNKL